MSIFDRPKKPHKKPLDERLAEKAPRADGARPASLVKSRLTLRLDRPEEIAALAVGAMVLQKVDAFGQTRVFGRAIDALLEKATSELSSEEVMHLEVEAYTVLDWLVGGALVTDEDAESVARRDGDQILYDPNATIVELLGRALDEEFDVKIDYFSRRRGEMNTRRVTPLSLDAETYLRAYCHARQDERTFRLNRITRCVPVKGRPIEVVQKPARDAADESSSRPLQISLLDDD